VLARKFIKAGKEMNGDKRQFLLQIFHPITKENEKSLLAFFSKQASNIYMYFILPMLFQR
jgi:hypothetical protein